MLVRLLAATLVLLCFELGFVLLFIAWTPYWQFNYFLFRWPALAPWLTSFYIRGAVSGLGLIDIGIAFGFLVNFTRLTKKLESWLDRHEAPRSWPPDESESVKNR